MKAQPFEWALEANCPRFHSKPFSVLLWSWVLDGILGTYAAWHPRRGNLVGLDQVNWEAIVFVDEIRAAE